MAEWRAWLGCGWHWLNDNGVAVTAVVTAVYAFFTLLLWWATRRQAALTQRALDATNRPYLSIRVDAEAEPPAGRTDVVQILGRVENVGTIPAQLMRWEVSGQLMNLDGAFETINAGSDRTLQDDSVFPRDPYDVVLEFTHPGILGTPLPLRFVVTLKYRGVAIPEKTYETVLEGERTPSRHRQQTRAT